MVNQMNGLKIGMVNMAPETFVANPAVQEDLGHGFGTVLQQICQSDGGMDSHSNVHSTFDECCLGFCRAPGSAELTVIGDGTVIN